jgi:hypothetical protein
MPLRPTSVSVLRCGRCVAQGAAARLSFDRVCTCPPVEHQALLGASQTLFHLTEVKDRLSIRRYTGQFELIGEAGDDGS